MMWGLLPALQGMNGMSALACAPQESARRPIQEICAGPLHIECAKANAGLSI